MRLSAWVLPPRSTQMPRSFLKLPSQPSRRPTTILPEKAAVFQELQRQSEPVLNPTRTKVMTITDMCLYMCIDLQMPIPAINGYFLHGTNLCPAGAMQCIQDMDSSARVLSLWTCARRLASPSWAQSQTQCVCSAESMTPGHSPKMPKCPSWQVNTHLAISWLHFKMQICKFARPSADCYLPSERVQHECTYLHFHLLAYLPDHKTH